jgi:hypothetical protein
MVYQALVTSQRTKVINSPYVVLHISNWQVEWKTMSSLSILPLVKNHSCS